MSDYVQPLRTADDGSVEVENNEDGTFSLRVEHKGEMQVIHATGYNASRLFGVLACMLGIHLSKALSKAIKL